MTSLGPVGCREANIEPPTTSWVVAETKLRWASTNRSRCRQPSVQVVLGTTPGPRDLIAPGGSPFWELPNRPFGLAVWCDQEPGQ